MVVSGEKALRTLLAALILALPVVVRGGGPQSLSAAERAALGDEPAATPKIASTNQTAALVRPAVPSFQISTNECLVFVGGVNTWAAARHGYLETLLTRRHPYRAIQFRNLSWDGDTVFRQERPSNYGDLTQQLKEHAATALILDFGLREARQGSEALPAFITAYEELLAKISTVTPRIVLLSPTRLEARSPADKDSVAGNAAGQSYAAAIRELAARRGLPFVDLFRLQASDPSEPGALALTEDGQRLSAYGHWRAAYEIERSLGFPQVDWTVDINAASLKSEAAGTTLSRVVIGKSLVRFQAFDPFLPGPVFRKDEVNVSVWRTRRLRVTGLAPGRYVLKIDGKPLYEKGHLVWESGPAVTRGPEFDQVEALRTAIVEKNQHFSSYWQSLGGTPAKAEATDSPARPLQDQAKDPPSPEESQRLLRLVSRKESEIRELVVPRPHIYELSRRD